ncbi:MAG: hypothetical protein PF961_08650 [Planctomycetota bacterium]|jgi:hypothetical protein|nr:hypothetical protein [Planctomycetota bacterium]
MSLQLDRYFGVTLGFCARRGWYETQQAQTEFDRIADLGIPWVCLVATVMQETVNSPRQFADFECTPSDFELVDTVAELQRRGIKVCLRPMIECYDGHGRNRINFPPDGERIPGRVSDCWERWFRGMRARTRHYARLAQRSGCEMYCLDSEIDGFVGRCSDWRSVVEVAREEYHGHLNSCHTHAVNFERELEDPAHWFRDLDSLATSFYHPSAADPSCSVADRVEYLQPKLAMYRRIATSLGRPVWFGECGCRSLHGACRSPSSWRGGGGYDGDDQARHLQAVLETFRNEEWWAGLFWWKWDEHNVRPNFTDEQGNDLGFTVFGKPAAEVMRAGFGAEAVL